MRARLCAVTVFATLAHVLAAPPGAAAQDDADGRKITRCCRASRVMSEARAAAVKQYLVANFGVAGDRLTTSGLGDTKPVADNATDDGRAQNRRVELIRR